MTADPTQPKRGVGKARQEKEARKRYTMSGLSLWAAGAPSSRSALRNYIERPSEFPRAATTHHQKLGGWKQRRCTLSQFRKPEV